FVFQAADGIRERNVTGVQTCALPIYYDVEDFIGEFEDSLDEVIDEINELSIPDGLTSTIWANKNLILQREFILNIGTSDSELVKIGRASCRERVQHYELTVSV